jgi:hypothetical protein
MFSLLSLLLHSDTSQAVHSVAHQRSLTFITYDFLNIWLITFPIIVLILFILYKLYIQYLERTTANRLDAIGLQHITIPHLARPQPILQSTTTSMNLPQIR